MANRKQSRGYCKYCGKEYTRAGMVKHMASCKMRKAVLEAEDSKNRCGYFEILIMGKYDKNYWLLIEINDNATLRDLDIFLRDIWVECCGHLSSFEIEGISYDVIPDESSWEPAKNMEIKLKHVLSEGMTFTYEYDFGSTTTLLLEVKDHRRGVVKKDKITILSRNKAEHYTCSICGKREAKWINQEYFWDPDEPEYLCDECADKEEYDYALPVCNSPRMGVCGYGGNEIYPEEFEPDVKPESAS